MEEAEKKPTEAVEESKDIIANYVLLKDMGSNKTGDIVALPESVGKHLCDAGHATHAKEEDMAQDKEVADTAPIVTNSIDRIADEITTKAVEATQKVIKENMDRSMPQPVPAEVKEPHYKSLGGAVRDWLRSIVEEKDGVKNTSRLNRLNEYQEEARQSYLKAGYTHPELHKKAILGINESVNSAGGFLVNNEFSKNVFVNPHNQMDLCDMCGEQIDAVGNLLNYRFINESALNPAGSIYGGLNNVAVAEGASFTASQPLWANTTLQLSKLALFMYLTSEVIQDNSYSLEKSIEEYAIKANLYGRNNAFIQGGLGFEGILNNPGLVTVTSSSNDVAYHTTPTSCLTYADLSNMWAQVYPDSQASASGVWLFHPSLLASLNTMTYSFSVGGVPVWSINYDARKGLDGVGAMTPYSIFGKPAFAHFACSAPGAAGDIIYLDMNTCVNYRKPFRIERSNEVQFLTDQIAIRFVSRNQAKGLFRNPVYGVNGSSQFSSMVTRSAVGT